MLTCPAGMNFKTSDDEPAAVEVSALPFDLVSPNVATFVSARYMMTPDVPVRATVSDSELDKLSLSPASSLPIGDDIFGVPSLLVEDDVIFLTSV